MKEKRCFNYIFILIISLMFISGCSSNSSNDSDKFKEEYEKYNIDGYIYVTDLEDNIFSYKSNEEIKNIIESDTGVIFIGQSDDNMSRCVLNILISLSYNTDLDVIYYNSDINSVINYIDEDISTPVVLFVVDGDIVSYHIGTISNKEQLDSDEEEELYNIYLEGVHKVLGDVCDERC